MPGFEKPVASSAARPTARGFAPRTAVGLLAGAVALSSLTLLSDGARSATNRPNASALSRPHVYLMRGLMNIFSLGMDQLAVQIERHGIAAAVYNHSNADSVVAEIAQKYRAGDRGPYILVGHSLGADAVMVMAQELNKSGVPVALVVPFDGTASYPASPNVACVLNMTQRRYAYMTAGAGFHGKLTNMDVSYDTSIDHITIDKSPRLQGVALTSVLQAAHQETCRPANAPAVASPKAVPAPAAKLVAPKPGPAPRVVTPTESASPVALRPGDEG
jgi:hypothetical protein